MELTGEDARDTHDELLPAAHRLIRRLEPPESPYPGMLVSDGERQRVRVDVTKVPTEWWELAGAEHAAGVCDLIRTAEGHTALLPWCVEPVDRFLSRRAAEERPLQAGEVVTLVGSLLRGISEVGARVVPGRWWLDDRGRPLFVGGEGESCAIGARAHVELLREQCTDRALERVLGQIGAGMEDHRVVQRSLEEWERELTELAASRPLQNEFRAPERVADIPVHRARLTETLVAGMGETRRAQRRTHVTAERHCGSVLAQGLEGLRRSGPRWAALRARLGHLGQRPTAWHSAIREKADAARTPRKRLLVVGVATAGVVLLGGLLWPSTADSGPVAEARFSQPTARPSVSPSDGATGSVPTANPSPPTQTTGDSEAPPSRRHDIVAQATRLLAAIDKCGRAGDADCADVRAEGGPADLVKRLGTGLARRAVTLVEDYGDVAVVRVAGTENAREQMMVLVRQNDGWLVRDMYHIADQPSDSG